MNIIRIITMITMIADYCNGHYAEGEVEDELVWGINFKNTLSVLKNGVDLEIFNHYDYINVNLVKYKTKN